MKVAYVQALLGSLLDRVQSCSLCGLLPPRRPWGGHCEICHNAVRSGDSDAVAQRLAIAREACAYAALFASAPTPPAWSLVLDPEDGSIELICEVCGSPLRPLPGNRRGDGGLRCWSCPEALWEADC